MIKMILCLIGWPAIGGKIGLATAGNGPAKGLNAGRMNVEHLPGIGEACLNLFEGNLIGSLFPRFCGQNHHAIGYQNIR